MCVCLCGDIDRLAGNPRPTLKVTSEKELGVEKWYAKEGRIYVEEVRSGSQAAAEHLRGIVHTLSLAPPELGPT